MRADTDAASDARWLSSTRIPERASMRSRTAMNEIR
jgi:hypothetical protein